LRKPRLTPPMVPARNVVANAGRERNVPGWRPFYDAAC
jgi:hypothetical protein